MSSRFDAKIGPTPRKHSLAGGRRGVRWEVNLPPWGRGFGRKREKKKGRKDEGKLGGKGGR